MRCYLAVVAKSRSRFRRGEISPDITDRVARASSLAFPVTFDVRPPQVWRSKGVAMWGWTNEPDGPLFVVRGDGVEGTTGYRSADSGRSGLWATFHASPRGVTASTSATRVEPVYWAEDRDHVCVGSNALLVHVVMTGTSQPVYDLTYVAGYVNAEFVLGDWTPFAGVTTLPNDTTLEVTGTRVRTVPARGAGHGGAPSAERLAHALVHAVLPLRGSAVVAGLTGGRDSRLVVAALRAAGIPFVTRTAGRRDHPDVVIAARIAGMLGVDHIIDGPNVESRATGEVVVVDPLRRARDAVRLGQGMISAYENLGSPGPFDGTTPKLGGHGGELLRGGYGHYAPSIRAGGAERYLENLMTRNNPVLVEDARAEWTPFVNTWLDAARATPAAALYDFYLRYRAGRWSAAARSAYTVRDRLVQPLFDHDVITAVTAADPDRRVDERLVHDTLRHLAPDLTEVPFFGRRWRFEEDGPAAGQDHDRWMAGAPLDGSKAPSATFNWRVHYGVEVRDLFRDQILGDSRASSLFDVLDRRRVESLLDQSPPGPARLLWSIFTLSVLLSGSWLSGPDESHPVEVPVR